jgi:fatty-acyl-CoA synthase
VAEHVSGSRLYGDWVAEQVPEGEDGVVSIVSCGKPFPTMGIEILSDEYEPLPDGQVGYVALRSPSRLMFYKDDPESTEQAIRGDLLLTGDLGYKRDENLFWVGRAKERITIRGKKYDPSDFEPVLFDIEGLRKGCFVVFGVDDHDQGTQRIVVVSEVREPLERSLEDISTDISRQVFLRLGISISRIELVKSGTLAKTSSGKRRHRHFQQLYAEGKLAPYLVEDAAADAPMEA